MDNNSLHSSFTGFIVGCGIKMGNAMVINKANAHGWAYTLFSILCTIILALGGICLNDIRNEFREDNRITREKIDYVAKTCEQSNIVLMGEIKALHHDSVSRQKLDQIIYLLNGSYSRRFSYIAKDTTKIAYRYDLRTSAQNNTPK